MTFTLFADTPVAVGSAFPALADVVAGGYTSIFKGVVLLGLLLLWCRLLSWSSDDAKRAHMPQYAFNGANMLGLLLAYGLVFFAPYSFWIVLPVILVIMTLEAAAYLHVRNRIAGLKDLKKQWQDWRSGLKRAKRDESPGPITFSSKAGPVPVPVATAPERVGYNAAQLALADPLKKGAEQIDMAPIGQGAMKVKYLVDCVSYDSTAALDASSGGEGVNFVKQAAGLDIAEKRKPQSGSMKLLMDDQKYEVKVQSAGTTAGEYIRLMISPERRHALKFDELGFDEVQAEVVKELMLQAGGVVLLATPKGQGLTQLMYGMLRGHDVFMQHIQSIERDPPETLQGVTPNKLAPNATPEDELKAVDWVISQDPEVLLLDKLENPKSATSLIPFSAERRAYVGMRAGSIIEAIEQWRQMAGQDPGAIDALKMVIAGRVIRKLCTACKESYAPDPNTLKKLNMSPEKVTTLYKARETPMRDPKGNPIPCTFCHDLHFKGRVGVFEVLPVTDDIKAAIKADGPRLGSNFKAAFRKNRNRYLQEESLTLVEEGITSVQEVLRVLKPGETPGGTGAAAPARAPAAAPRQAPRAPAAAPARRPAPR